MRKIIIGAGMIAGVWGTPAMAQEVKLKALIDARIRYEDVDQAGIALDAEAFTARVRAGIEAKTGDFSALVESEATLAMVERYNSSVNGKTQFPTVADPENIELNRAQIQYTGIAKTVVTVGRQRINLDDQRFVGAVGWRQNEQTFDAVRVESSALGPVSLDLTYSWSDRTIFGIDSPIQAIGGNNVFASAGVKVNKKLTVKGFAYLIDQDAPTRLQFSSQTYGLRAVANFPFDKTTKLTLTASYARQSDWQKNPNNYAADYWLGEASMALKTWTLTAGYEVLGASSGAAFTSFQTPLATLHKFQGWADKFLTTPPNGITDLYGSIGYSIPKTPVGPVSLLVAYHRYESDRLSLHYGNEWNAQLVVKPFKHVAVTAKYADYDADSFATDTRKFWLQLEYIL